jgi:hypothetical protein
VFGGEFLEFGRRLADASEDEDVVALREIANKAKT